MSLKINTLDGAVTELEDTLIEQLSQSLRGELLLEDQPGYHQARAIWNGMIDKRPAAIAQCTGSSDVLTAVGFARDHQLQISVKGGGHNIAGSAVCDGGLMIDLSLMRGVIVDPENRTARVQPGALLGDVDHETQAFGLAVPSGINSTTGIAGLALGGGYGWLSRTYGHTVDNLLSADIVTADGEFLQVSERQNADLYWAIRGGSGNFGIVTQFNFQLHPVGPAILSGPVIYPLEDAAKILKQYREIAKDLPDEASCWFVIRKAPPFPFLDPGDHGRPVIVLAMAYIGDIHQGEKVLAPLRQLSKPLADAVGPHPYAGWQAAFDPLLGAGARNYWKSSDFIDISDELIGVLLESASHLPSDECEIFVAQLGGAAARVDGDAMAFPHRQTRFTMNIHGRWQTNDMDESCISWVRKTYQQAEQHSTGSVYVNFVPENGEQRKIGPYGANLKRLQQIKAKYDPSNLFRSNINIEPKAEGE